MNFINHRYAANSSDPNVIKLKQLSKTTKKTFRITLGKNEQELKRLGLLNNILEKNYNYEDNNWLRDLIETRRYLNEITKNITPNYINVENKNEINADENLSSSSSLSISTVCSSSSLSTSKDQVQKYSKSKKIFKLNSQHKKRFNSSIKEYNNRKNTNDSSNEYQNKSTEYIPLTSTPYQSFLTSKNYFDKSRETRAQTVQFPLTNIRSYTSMVGAHNDKSLNDLNRFRLKSSFEARSLNTVLYKNQKRELDEKKKPLLTAPMDLDLLDDNYQLIKNKSIRRPKKNIASAFEILNKLKTLNANLKTCKDQQKVNFQFDDRNVRYGNEVKSEKNKHLRQLKLISKFEALKI